MALSQSSKILVSDINTALAGKQDTLGYTPVKSVNGTQADSSGNVAISVSAPVTSVNGMTGAVTINVAGTKVNNAGYADSSWSATVTPNVYFNPSQSAKSTIPSGGTWKYVANYVYGNDPEWKTASVAGGTTVTNGYSPLIAIRVA